MLTALLLTFSIVSKIAFSSYDKEGSSEKVEVVVFNKS